MLWMCRLEFRQYLLYAFCPNKTTLYFFSMFFFYVSLLCRQDSNQLIRASALRVLSSIRVPIIVPIMMLAIKEAATDLSPYVRKTAAHAIQKLYRYRHLYFYHCGGSTHHCTCSFQVVACSVNSYFSLYSKYSVNCSNSFTHFSVWTLTRRSTWLRSLRNFWKTKAL